MPQKHDFEQNDVHVTQERLVCVLICV